MLFIGFIFDKDIIEESGFFKLLLDFIQSGKLQNGDGVMVDKGFYIEKEIVVVGFKLNILFFVFCVLQMKVFEVVEIVKIVKYCVYVECVIVCIKQFKILLGKISLFFFLIID